MLQSLSSALKESKHKQKNTHSYAEHSASNSLLLPATKWILSSTTKQNLKQQKRTYKHSSNQSATKSKTSKFCLSPHTLATILSKNQQTWHGMQDQHSLKHSTNLIRQKNQHNCHCDFRYRTSTILPA